MRSSGRRRRSSVFAQGVVRKTSHDCTFVFEAFEPASGSESYRQLLRRWRRAKPDLAFVLIKDGHKLLRGREPLSHSKSLLGPRCSGRRWSRNDSGGAASEQISMR